MLLPIFLTGLYYLLPSTLQHFRLIQFLPQISAYVALGIWCASNVHPLKRLGWSFRNLGFGIKWGGITGMLLGAFNTIVILWGVPGIGGDIEFLNETPHAHMPTWVMVPWGIFVIALGVELNFRGFLLGRLAIVSCHWLREYPTYALNAGRILAVGVSALVFAFDPFMVTTFRHLHWIAVWDGLIWGWIVVRTNNLLTVIVAHAVEVMILYSCIKFALN
ncbi:type II CAAX prenyl endopeptidase Rce1 family protein [Candidatus Nitronereus thalassa]|uniref:CPBP family glutamic-type intramembrane protease n=1 Tax=Candidatus Nitronereus thalassa TaxID=3020898 RepID=A0ABU3K3G5_9BACT|nr:CPBP family glutamic-type intramembrane protease [Candidatus Nitronereus thalassa]MDT7040926.1 CPBP family glutamic-type intramembrane protease [Candidatus Nitronereus thalassa]